MNKEIILGLDISTKCIGACVFENDGSEHGKIIELTHITPKVSSKIKTIEQLFIKDKLFQTEFLNKWKNIGDKFKITRVVIEEPLVRSNNVNTVATLIRFNGMISKSVYESLGIVPEYISSYDARKYAFPELMSVRKFNKKGEQYPVSKIISSINKNQLVLFGEYPWDIDKKQVIWDKVCDIYPTLEWVYNKKGELKKENFDMSDALITCKAVSNISNFGDGVFEVINSSNDGKLNVKYSVKIWDKIINKELNLIDSHIKYSDKEDEEDEYQDDID